MVIHIARNNRILTTTLAVIVALALLAGAFYVGRAYQNSIDQSLFTAYNPPQRGSGGAASGASFGGSAGGNSSFSFAGGNSQRAQINAALAVGTPPPTAGVGSSTTQPSGQAGGSGSAGNAAGSGGQAAPGGTTQAATATGGVAQGSAGGAATGGAGGSQGTASGTASAVTGQLSAISATTLTLQSFGGQAEDVAIDAGTRFYQLKTAAGSDLATGQQVTISLDPTDTSRTTASGVTIIPAGAPLVRVRAFGGNAGGGFGGGGSGNGGGFGAGGNGGGGYGGGGNGGGNGAGGAGTGRVRAATPSGTITAVSSSSITLKTAQGTKTYKLGSSAAIYRVVSVASSALQTNTLTSVHEAAANGKTTADAVLQAGSPGAFASFIG